MMEYIKTNSSIKKVNFKYKFDLFDNGNELRLICIILNGHKKYVDNYEPTKI